MLQASHQHLTANVLRDRRLELALDEFSRRFAGPESGDRSAAILEQLVELLLESLVDCVSIDRDLDVLLARTDVGDLDGLLELLLFRFRRPARRRPL